MTKRTYKIVALVLVTILCAVAIFIGHKKLEEAENRRLISEYCIFTNTYLTGSETLEDCVHSLLMLDEEIQELKATVNSKFPSWRENTADHNQMLLSVIDERSVAITNQIMSNCLFESEYSKDELFTSIANNYGMLRTLEERVNREEYAQAFSTFISRNPVYSDDCIHYIVRTIYPGIFDKGLRDRLLDVGVVAWSNSGQSMLTQLLKYIDSMPSGRSGYEADIATAQKQLADSTAKYIADEKQRMKETTTGYPFYVGMRESELRSTILGAPDSVEKSLDFDVKVPRARHKTYKWELTSEHGWYKVTVRYRRHNSRRFDDYEDLPADNGYVSDISWVPSKGKTMRTVSITDTYK